MKKKLLVTVLSAALVLSLAACGNATLADVGTSTEKSADAGAAGESMDGNGETNETGENAEGSVTTEAGENEAGENEAGEKENGENEGAEKEGAQNETEESSVEELPEEKGPYEITTIVPSKDMMEFSGEKGTVELITYTAKDYIGKGEDVEKNAYVYLPAGYDDSKQYNVIYLMHGIGGDENEWGLNKPATSRLKKICDNIIGNGEVEPFILVTPNGKAFACENSGTNDMFYKFGYELRNDLIPYIEGHYATYAEYNEEGYDLSATRNHRAMAGLSMGGMQTINIGICECMDLFSWYGAFSAAPTSYPASKVASYIDQSEYDIDYFYNICGLQDNIAYTSAAAAAKNVASFTEKLDAEKNFTWQEKNGAHDFNIWYVGIYNFAHIAFVEDGQVIAPSDKPVTDEPEMDISEENPEAHPEKFLD